MEFLNFLQEKRKDSQDSYGMTADQKIRVALTIAGSKKMANFLGFDKKDFTRIAIQVAKGGLSKITGKGQEDRLECIPGLLKLPGRIADVGRGAAPILEFNKDLLDSEAYRKTIYDLACGEP